MSTLFNAFLTSIQSLSLVKVKSVKKKVLHDILLCYIFTGLFSGIQLLIISQLSQFIRVTDLMHISATSMHFESLHCRAAQTIGK